MELIDLRSDTVTKPTPEMREVIARAEVGDDVYGEDPTVNQLEAESARILGKEAGLFLPSGTMGNISAILTHCGRGSEIILGNRAHTFLSEVGGIAALGGIQTHVLPNQKDGTLRVEDIHGAIRPEDIHDPQTQLITLENTHNECGGVVLSSEYTREVGAIARKNELIFHLDGARIFNAATALDVQPAVLVEPADSVMFCLSKGLGAPVGSVLCGTKDFIRRARKTRKMLGGGMRQAGVIAAAGLYALKHHMPLLKNDHIRTAALARGLSDIEGLFFENPSSNMIYLNLSNELPFNAFEAASKLKELGVLVGIWGEKQFRLALHFWITDHDIEQIIKAFKQLISES